MIKSIIIIALFSIPFVSCSQTKSVAKLQEKYKDENSFTLTFNNALKIIAVSSNAKNYSAKDIRRLKKELSEQNFEELMSIKNGKGEFHVHVIEKNGKATKLVMTADNESDGFIALDFTNVSED